VDIDLVLLHFRVAEDDWDDRRIDHQEAHVPLQSRFVGTKEGEGKIGSAQHWEIVS
jgi:hypothetical protein